MRCMRLGGSRGLGFSVVIQVPQVVQDLLHQRQGQGKKTLLTFHASHNLSPLTYLRTTREDSGS